MKFWLLLSVLVAGSTSLGAALAEPSFEVVTRNNVQLQPLNPLRGDASPKAGVLWGDIQQNIPTGTLIEFADGFSSPPHIHNITYRAVVISGSLHNDDPDAAVMWMGPGSFWTQPAGENHITAAGAGEENLAFLEILSGPYLVQPASEEFDNGERPINLEARNIVWLDASDIGWLEAADRPTSRTSPQMAFLWGIPEDGERNGTFLKLPAGFSGDLTGSDDWVRGVIVKGTILHEIPNKSSNQTLPEGSYFGAKGDLSQILSCEGEDECVIYISTSGKYRLNERQS